MILVGVKVLLAPSFVVGASLVARRFGPRVGGLVAGLPVVAGPVLLAYALAHGREFGAAAAAGTLLGLVSLIAFVVVYARLAGRTPWWLCMLAGWAAFAAVTAVFAVVRPPLGASLVLAGLALGGGLAALPRPGNDPQPQPSRPSWDLAMRAACALALVLTLTGVAGWLGPQLSGLLAPFPIIATVLATFTHTQRGTDELLRLLRAMLAGFGAFAVFCFTLALALRTIDTGAAFALATTLALLIQAVALMLVPREPAPLAPLTEY